MGIVKIEAAVRGPAGGHTVQFLVDSRANSRSHATDPCNIQARDAA